MKLIVGLGNPGNSYCNHRHNVGFQIVDLFAAQQGWRFDIKKGNARVALGVFRPTAGDAGPAMPLLLGEGMRVALAKPQTFMNLAGRSVQTLLHFYKVEPVDLLVIYDDLDLALGVLRLRAAGGSGGHNGMKSLIQMLGHSDFARLRVGIDRPPGRMDPADYVLQDFSAAQAEPIAAAREAAALACQQWLTLGVTAAMNKVNAASAL